jgi:hypothetical protein
MAETRSCVNGRVARSAGHSARRLRRWEQRGENVCRCPVLLVWCQVGFLLHRAVPSFVPYLNGK